MASSVAGHADDSYETMVWEIADQACNIPRTNQYEEVCLTFVKLAAQYSPKLAKELVEAAPLDSSLKKKYRAKILKREVLANSKALEELADIPRKCWIEVIGAAAKRFPEAAEKKAKELAKAPVLQLEAQIAIEREIKKSQTLPELKTRIDSLKDTKTKVRLLTDIAEVEHMRGIRGFHRTVSKTRRLIESKKEEFW